MSGPITRGTFVRRFGGALAALAFDPRTLVAAPTAYSPLKHPDPRPGITAERVLTAEAIGSTKTKVLSAYDAARQYPELFDSIACGCGCTGKDLPHRSLLVCFETRQPIGCMACQSEAELIVRLAKEETPLAEIRAAVDKEFG